MILGPIEVSWKILVKTAFLEVIKNLNRCGKRAFTQDEHEQTVIPLADFLGTHKNF